MLYVITDNATGNAVCCNSNPIAGQGQTARALQEGVDPRIEMRDYYYPNGVRTAKPTSN